MLKPIKDNDFKKAKNLLQIQRNKAQLTQKKLNFASIRSLAQQLKITQILSQVEFDLE